ncbi:MAG: hypothetical protein V3S18_06870 [Dehalococcoidia bacterium]
MRGQRLKVFLLLAVLALFAVAGACKDSTAQPGGRAQRGGGNLGVLGGGSGEGRSFGAEAAGEVIILDDGFTPATDAGGLRVIQDGTVTWVNNGAVDHHPVEDTGYFDLGVIAPGGSASFSFAALGIFEYYDKLHPEMKGVITVSAASK